MELLLRRRQRRDLLLRSHAVVTTAPPLSLTDRPIQALRSACAAPAVLCCAGDPARYVSCVPVHQDGSCNGLQHYAALGRDLSGGESVNLMPTDKPQVTR